MHCARGSRPGAHGLHDGVDVVDAAAPRASARLLERRPEARVFGQLRVGPDVAAGRTRGEDLRALLRTEAPLALADEVDASFQPARVDHDADAIALPKLPDRAAGERLGPHVADARPRRD